MATSQIGLFLESPRASVFCFWERISRFVESLLNCKWKSSSELIQSETSKIIFFWKCFFGTFRRQICTKWIFFYMVLSEKKGLNHTHKIFSQKACSKHFQVFVRIALVLLASECPVQPSQNVKLLSCLLLCMLAHGSSHYCVQRAFPSHRSCGFCW